MRTARRATIALALFSALQVVACDSPTGPLVQGKTRGAQISSVSPLEVGRTAFLRGRQLSDITELTIDGRPVDFSLRSDQELEFTVPEFRTCETDGRRVEILANHGDLRAEGAMRVRGTLRLEVAESRVLSAEELSCVQIAAGAEEYVLSVANLSRSLDPGPSITLHGLGTSGPAPAGLRAPASSAPAVMQDAGSVHLGISADTYGTYRPEVGKELFDDYVGAQVGDTLRFVDWRDQRALSPETTRKEDVPYYEALVIAATPQQIVVVDLRDPNAASAINVAPNYQKAAEIADRYMLQAIRATIDPEATLPRGRVVTILRTLEPGTLGMTSPLEYFISPWSSGIYAVRLNIEHAGIPEVAASAIIHEVAHMVDASVAARGEMRSLGWISEAFAVNAEDYAARLARGGSTGIVAPRPDAPPAPDMPRMPLPTSASHSPASRSPYGLITRGGGAYDRGARILRYAAERVGGVAEVYRRLSEAAPSGDTDEKERSAAWGIDRLAQMVGLTAEQLLTESMLAELTDDLVPEEDAVKHGLPQLKGWRHINEPLDMRVQDSLERTGTKSQSGQIVGGGYVAWMIPGMDGHGLSVSLKGKPDQHEVRITRVR